jgi:recombination protein RecT
VLGWKGYYQLALRSGQYRNLDAVAVKEGELEDYNPITGEIKLNPISDPVAREHAKTIGYYAFFELVNGFKKQMYWSKEKMEQHALKYSQGYRAKKGYTFWERDFDSMALKTMYRQLIGKYGIMSIDMQTAYANDTTIQPSILEDDEAPIYFDAEINETTGEVMEA